MISLTYLKVFRLCTCDLPSYSSALLLVMLKYITPPHCSVFLFQPKPSKGWRLAGYFYVCLEVEEGREGKGQLKEFSGLLLWCCNNYGIKIREYPFLLCPKLKSVTMKSPNYLPFHSCFRPKPSIKEDNSA